MRRAVLLALLTPLALGFPAHAHARTYAQGLAAQLDRDPVLVAPGAEPSIPRAEARRLRAAIRKDAPGRVQLAILPAPRVRRAGGVRRLANAVDKALGPHHGAVVLVAGRRLYAVTTHAGANGVTAILRAAVSIRPTLAGQLAYAIPFIARIDPGPVGDLNAARPNNPSPTPKLDFPDPTTGFAGGARKAVDKGTSIAKTIGIVFGALVVLGVVIPMFFALLRAFRRPRRAPPPTAPISAPPGSPLPVGPDGGRSAANEALGRPDV